MTLEKYFETVASAPLAPRSITEVVFDGVITDGVLGDPNDPKHGYGGLFKNFADPRPMKKDGKLVHHVPGTDTYSVWVSHA